MLAAMSSSSAATPPAVRSGVWDGSEVDDDDIEILCQTWRLPGRDLVRVRLAPEGETSPVPEEGKRVIFRSHLMRGLGLPASGFFRSFLEFPGLQPPHLTPNTVVLLAAFATLCEGFLGVLPTIELWGGVLPIQARHTRRRRAGPVRCIHRNAEISGRQSVSHHRTD